jgi:hypothetical protein
MSHVIYAALGSVSSGTLRAENLIPAFIDALDSLKDAMSTSGDASYKDDVRRIDAKLATIEEHQQADDYYECDEASFDLEELTDLLNIFAPPYAYFGTHPGDGADFGFWIPEDVAQQVRDSDGQVVSDLSELGDDYRGEALIVNDHGNCTLGYIDDGGEFVEVWAIV